jgi:hypothetical protein
MVAPDQCDVEPSDMAAAAASCASRKGVHTAAEVSMTYAERRTLIDALDQYISNAAESEELSARDAAQLATAADLLERFQAAELRDLGVSADNL